MADAGSEKLDLRLIDPREAEAHYTREPCTYCNTPGAFADLVRRTAIYDGKPYRCQICKDVGFLWFPKDMSAKFIPDPPTRPDEQM